MFDNHRFSQLVGADQPTGEVIAADRFLVWLSGLDTAPVGSLIQFENGYLGIVREVDENRVTVLNLTAEEISLGTLAVLASDQLTTGVGESLIGRMLSPLGKALDGKGPVHFTDQVPVFAEAPALMERDILNQQLVTGMSIVDMLFPIVLGQRIAIIGDSKSGKSGFVSQLINAQAGIDRLVVFVLIGKRKVDVDRLLDELERSKMIDRSIVITADMFESLAQAYLAPYVGAAIAEYFWKTGRDVVIVYDDLTSHAKIYRELSLLAQSSPGRDSYPGDMFYAHSSLLERSGKLASNAKTLTALPVVLAAAGDITGYLPTNIMSITDGQLVFDTGSFRQGVKPAIDLGLSVSRVGGRAQAATQKGLATRIFRKLADYRQAAELSRFGSELTAESRTDLELGKLIYAIFKQSNDEIYNLAEQQLMLEAVLATGGRMAINVSSLKRQVKELARSAGQEDYPSLVNQLVKDNTVQVAK